MYIQKLEKYSLLSENSSWKTEKDCIVAVAAVLEKKRGARLAGIDREFPDFSQLRGRARVSHARGGASDAKKNEGLPVVCWLDTLSSAEAPYGKFLNNIGRAGSDGKRERAGTSLLSFPFPAFPARCRFSLSPGPRPAATTARKTAPKEASAEERGLDRSFHNSPVKSPKYLSKKFPKTMSKYHENPS